MKKKLENNRNKTNKDKRRNAILYPIYKMFSWDLLSFYSIEFFVLYNNKGINSKSSPYYKFSLYHF